MAHGTFAGTILGTAAYMSPEQARGKPVDRRTDIWAFGCVLYEMLSGRQAFDTGDTISDAIAAILKTDVDWTALPADVPDQIRLLLKRCLEKDRTARIGEIGTARFLLTETIAPPERAVGSTEPGLRIDGLTERESPLWRRALPWAIASLACVAAATTLVLWAPWRTAVPARAARVSVEIGADASLSLDIVSGSVAILSPDGSLLAFVAQKNAGDTRPQMYVRRLDQLRALPLAGTEDAASPFFSPDGQWIAFFANGKLKKISVAGGAAVTLCDVPNGRGGTWADDDTIIYSPANTIGVSLMRVSATGGAPDRLTTLERGEVTQRFPQILPGGKAVLFMSRSATGGYDEANLVVQPLPSGPRKVILRGGYNGRYVSSGHLLYLQGGTLFAAPFDLNRLELAGQPVPVVEGVASGPGGGAQFATSLNGTLVYEPGQSSGGAPGIEWMDRDGKTTTMRSTPANWSNIMFAPDGRRLAVDIVDGAQGDVWVYELAGDRLSRLTLDAALDYKPVWTPDGRRIAFASQRDGAFNLYWQRADGTGDAQRLTTSKNIQFPVSWHPSGKALAFYEQRPQTGNDLMILPMEGDEASGWKPGEPRVLLSTRFAEGEPMFSPDGRWLAYVSNKTGRDEVYVRPFTGPEGEWQISTGGGSTPTWSRSRHELFYAGPDARIMVSGYAVEGDAFRGGKSRVWSDALYRTQNRGFPFFRSFDLHPDGQRFAIAKRLTGSGGQAKVDKVVLVFNFFDELRRLAPRGRR
jgi:serine/threonine-protein kinase